MLEAKKQKILRRIEAQPLSHSRYTTDVEKDGSVNTGTLAAEDLIQQIEA